MFVDIKQMDPVKHSALTGVSNDLILANVWALAASNWPGFVVVRIPVVPGCNDSVENVRAPGRFVREAGLEVVNLLPFHRLGGRSTASSGGRTRSRRRKASGWRAWTR